MEEMKNWPFLAPFGRTLSLHNNELFYYDSEGSADSEGNADSASDGDKPTLILIHGLGDEADTWRHIVPLLMGEGYRIIAPDLPGFGRSLWKGRISLHSQCKAITCLMHTTGAANADRPAILIGSSLGACIAEMIAGNQPELVKGIILIGGCFPCAHKLNKTFFLPMLPFVGKNWYRSFRSNHDAAWRSLYPYYHNIDAMSSADRDFLRKRVIARVESPNQERGYLATMRSMHLFFLFGKRRMATRIQTFPGKIHILWGEYDNVFPLNNTASLRTLRPDADCTLIPDAGHLPNQENPEASAAEILRILQSA